MAQINSRLIFITTSPRTPEKMVPEIKVLIDHFEGKVWNAQSQRSFMEVLRDKEFFNGNGAKDPAFSARDRINRGPKALGFVKLSPYISPTEAGLSFINARNKDEIFLRQLLKFQVPSPYHIPSSNAAKFWIKPYLELIRLIRVLGTLKFDELQIFGLQLTDWHNFDKIIAKIEHFRSSYAISTDNYRTFRHKYLLNELSTVYADRISNGLTKTRESRENSINSFLETQARNTRDYADACFRYLKATGLINVSHSGKSLSIIPERAKDVDFILSTIERDPIIFENESAYVTYLGNATLPLLLTDNKSSLIERLNNEFPNTSIPPDTSITQIKNILSDLCEMRKNESLRLQVKEIKDYKLYNDIQLTYNRIISNELYDAPLMLEWNTWRAMTMLNGGEIKPNLSFDDFGQPLYTAQGNMPDIICNYGDFLVTVEVTTAKGQRQFTMENDSVPRHLGQLKNSTGKTCYGLFIAPSINDACVGYFYGLHHVNVSYYGGKAIIIPLPLYIFQKMLEDSYKLGYPTSPIQLRNFFETSIKIAHSTQNEIEWYSQIKQLATNWLNLSTKLNHN